MLPRMFLHHIKQTSLRVANLLQMQVVCYGGKQRQGESAQGLHLAFTGPMEGSTAAPQSLVCVGRGPQSGEGTNKSIITKLHCLFCPFLLSFFLFFLPQKIRTVGEVYAVGPQQICCQDLLFEAFIHPLLIQISRSFRKGFWQSHSWKDFHH